MRGKGFCRVCLRAVALALAAGILFVGGFAKDRRKDKRKPTRVEDLLSNPEKGIPYGIKLNGDEGQKNTGPLNYPALPLVGDEAGSINSPNTKRIKLKKEEFEQLWNQIVNSGKQLEFNPHELYSLKVKTAEVNGVKSYSFNMRGFKKNSQEWVEEHPYELETSVIYFPDKDYDIGDSGWSVAVSPTMIEVIRQINGQKYIVGRIRDSPHDILVPIIKENWDLYVFRKDFNDGTGSYDFAVLRLKDAYKYGFTGSQERYDLWIGWDNASLHVWFEVPKGYEVVGLMPEILKIQKKSEDEVVNIYVRGMYLALKEKRENGKELLIYVGVGETDLATTVNFQLAYK